MAKFGTLDSPGIGRTIVRVLMIFGVAIVVLWIGCSTTKRVDAGHVGVKVKLTGSERGVQPQPLDSGWHFYNPLTEQVILFPTNVHNIVWTASPHEGKPVDESLTFSSSEGANVTADIGLSFHIEPALAPKLYERFRLNDMMVLANGYVRNAVRECFGEVASKMPVQEIYGLKKTQMQMDVLAKLRAMLAKDGILIDQLTINGALRLPELVAKAIDRAMEQTQTAIQSENRVRQVRAEAEQAITQAHGAAEAARQRAQGEADAILIRARSEAQANEIIRLSVGPTVMQYRAVERWDGKLPVYQAAGQVPLLTFDVSKLDVLSEADRQRRLKEILDTPAPTGAGNDKAAAAASPALPAAPVAPPAPAPALPRPKNP